MLGSFRRARSDSRRRPRTSPPPLMVEELEPRTLLSAAPGLPLPVPADIPVVGSSGLVSVPVIDPGTVVNQVTALVRNSTPGTPGIPPGVPVVTPPAPTGGSPTTPLQAPAFGQQTATTGNTDAARNLARLAQAENTGLPVTPPATGSPDLVVVTPAAGAVGFVEGQQDAGQRRFGDTATRVALTGTPTAAVETTAAATTPVTEPAAEAGAWLAACDQCFADHEFLARLNAGAEPENAVPAGATSGPAWGAVLGSGLLTAALGGYLSDPSPEAEQKRPQLPGAWPGRAVE